MCYICNPTALGWSGRKLSKIYMCLWIFSLKFFLKLMLWYCRGDVAPQTFENIQIYDNVRDIQANDLPVTSCADLGAKRVPYFIPVLFRRVIRGYNKMQNCLSGGGGEEDRGKLSWKSPSLGALSCYLLDPSSVVTLATGIMYVEYMVKGLLWVGGGDYSVPIFFSVYMLKRSRGLHLGVGGTGHWAVICWTPASWVHHYAAYNTFTTMLHTIH